MSRIFRYANTLCNGSKHKLCKTWRWIHHSAPDIKKRWSVVSLSICYRTASPANKSKHFVLSFKDLNWIRVLVSSFQVFPPKPLETLLTWMKGGVTSIINNFDSNYSILLVLVSQTISLLLFGKFRSMIINSESSHCQNDQELSSFWLFR